MKAPRVPAAKGGSVSEERNVVDVIDRSLTRRKALARFTQALGALLVGVVAGPKKAQACGQGCCTLCFTENTGFNNANCDCIWGWKCKDSVGPNATCYYYQCEECIVNPRDGCTLELCWTWYEHNACGSACESIGVVASRYTQTITKVAGCTPP
jgi:hypothetical protein